MKQNEVVCYPGPALIFFISIWIFDSGARKVTGSFQKRALLKSHCGFANQDEGNFETHFRISLSSLGAQN